MTSKRRSILTLFSLALLAVATPSLWAEKLYVFYPATVRPQVMQQKLTDLCKGTEVVVFGRYEDFKAKVEADGPDAILTKSLLLAQFPGYTATAKATNGGRTDDIYVLLSVDAAVDPTTVDAKTMIGAIDFLGRAGMSEFIKKGFAVEPMLKRVTKVEDLLPLLTFKMAKAVLVSKDFVPYFKQTSQLKFVETPLNEFESGIASVATKNGGTAVATLKAVKAIPQPSSIFPGVDQWK